MNYLIRSYRIGHRPDKIKTGFHAIQSAIEKKIISKSICISILELPKKTMKFIYKYP